MQRKWTKAMRWEQTVIVLLNNISLTRVREPYFWLNIALFKFLLQIIQVNRYTRGDKANKLYFYQP